MKKLWINFLVKAMLKVSGKTKDALILEWNVHYFLTRNKWKAYWRSVFH